MTVSVQFDSDELDALARAFHGIPGSIKTKVLGKAMRRVRDTARSRVVKRAAERIDIPQNRVRQKTAATFNAGGNTITVILRSSWWPLYALGARQTRTGVTVKMRGSYAHAFIAEMESGHSGVWRRVPGTSMAKKRGKEQIRELFGPNPASDVANHDDVYLNVLTEVLDEVLLPRVLHELERALPG